MSYSPSTDGLDEAAAASVPFRLGFLSHLQGTTEPGTLYRDYVEIFVAAEELGFDSVWVAQHRLWQAAFSQRGARYVGGAGSRLLLNRATFGAAERTDIVQAPWTEAYLAAHPGRREEVRIGLSRGVYPAGDKRAAKEAIQAPVMAMAGQMIRNGLFPSGLSTEDYFERLHISYGSPEEVAIRLASDRVLPLATDLILQFSPASPAPDQAMRALEMLATQVAPALGWHPHARHASDAPDAPHAVA